jgi:Domain of unknown function (DUF397)
MNHDDVTAPWRKSSYSNSQANCVEVARTRSGKVTVRDSRNTDDVALSFSPDEWQTFVAKVQTMAPHSLGAWAAAPRGGSLLCHQVMITAAKRPKQVAIARENH